MRDQDLVKRLGEAALAQRQITTMLEQTAAGEASDQDWKPFEGEVRTNPEVRTARELCKPLGSSFLQRLMARARVLVQGTARHSEKVRRNVTRSIGGQGCSGG